MAFWSKKKKEEVVHRYDLTEKPKEIKPEPVKVSFIDTIRETDFGFARIVSVRRNSNGVTAHLLLDPSFIFPSGSQRMGGPNRGFSPTMNKYDDGLLLVDGIPSRISNINLEVFITEPGRSRHYDNGYYRDRDEYRDRYSNRSMLTFERQVLSNAFDGLVTQTKNSILTDGKYRVELKVSSNIEVSDQSDLRYQISNLRDRVKSLIEDDYRKEIIKSKLVETKDKFFTDLSPELMADIFQHVTDIVPDCKLIINTESTSTFPIIKFFVPLIGKDSAQKSQKISFDFNEKTSNILYELSECANRIKGYCDNSVSKISFGSDGILIETFPEVISQHLEAKDYSELKDRSMNDEFFRDSMYGDWALRQRQIRVRDPHSDWNLG